MVLFLNFDFTLLITRVRLSEADVRRVCTACACDVSKSTAVCSRYARTSPLELTPLLSAIFYPLLSINSNCFHHQLHFRSYKVF